MTFASLTRIPFCLDNDIEQRQNGESRVYFVIIVSAHCSDVEFMKAHKLIDSTVWCDVIFVDIMKSYGSYLECSAVAKMVKVVIDQNDCVVLPHSQIV